MENITFLIIIFTICCVWYWIPDIILTWHYCKYRLEDFIKYLQFKIKNRKNE